MNLNPIDFNYQDGLNRFPIQDYIDDAIKNDIITSNIYMNDGTSLNEVCYYSNITNTKHLYIKNNKQFGEIRFSTYVNYPDNGSNFGVKITNDGKLFVYHNFNILQPTFSAGFYDVESEILQLKADGISTDIQLTGLEASTVFLQTQISLSQDKIAVLENFRQAMINAYTRADTFETFQSTLLAPNSPATIQAITQSFNVIRSRSEVAYNSALAQGAIYGVAIGLGGAVIAYISSKLDQERTSNAIYANTNITTTEKNNIYNTQSNVASNLSNISNFNRALYDLDVNQGFINCNIITAQTIPSINTNTITYNGVEISTTLNNYLLKQGGTMSGRINFNYGANVGIPVPGGGGSGERVVLNTNGITGSDYPSAVGVSLNSLWFSAPNNSNFQWYNNGNEIMNLSSAGNLILNNPITTAERQYPPKAYNDSTNENVITYLGQSGMLSSTITLNPIGITYGSGVYELYSSSRYNSSEYQKRDLFNYNTTTNEVGGHWAGGQYSSIGVYQGIAYIKPDYLGEFLVVKLPSPIVLTRFRFYPRLGFNNRIPGEFRFYGSMNGVDFTEITQASQITPRLTTNDIINGYYEKTLTAGFNTPYLYIGFTVNKLIGTTNPDSLNFQEFQIFGKELLSSTASLAIGTSDATTYALNVNGVANATILRQAGQDITVISSNITLTQTPNLQKKYMFTGTCYSSMLMPDGITYFAYDIDLRNYTQLKYAPNPNTPYRIFKIKVFFGSVYFGYLTNGKPNVISYEVYMSNESQGGGGGIGSAGLNVCAIGYPENVILNTISPTQLSLVCGDFNFITVLSRVNGTVFNAIIEDCLF